MTSAKDDRLVGRSVARREDPRLLSGRGRFVDDIELPGMLHAQFVRSTVAHGTITEIDLTRVRQVPGVVAAFTAADLELGDITAQLGRPLSEFVPTAMPVLARDRVRYVGEPVAVVVARDPYLAEDGLEAAKVTYAPLPPITCEEQALAPGAPRVHAEAAGNTLVDVGLFATEGIDEIFDQAPCVVHVDVRTGRQNALPLETRGAVAQWDAREEQLVLHTCTQTPHQVRTVASRCLRLDERAVRVIVPDMGGGFGLKCVVGREEIAAAAAALRLGRPVKWIEDRKDALSASFLAREQHYTARAAFDADGRILGLDADVVCDMGAYSCYPFTAGIEPLMASAEMPGVYKVPAYRVRGRAITTNKAPTAPYRGVSRPQYVMAMERLMERAARELRLDPVEIRRRNVITDFPYTGVNNITYDPGSYLESLDLCERAVREAGWYDRQAAATAEGRHIGIGYSCFSERTGYGSAAFAQRKMEVVPGFDLAEVRMDTSGAVTATTGTISHGQSHETTMAQIVADTLGLDIAKVKLHQGDTDRITYGWGTFASRSIAVGGSAVRLAAGKLGDKLRAIAADEWGILPEETELDRGRVRRRDDPDVALSYEHLADTAYLKSHLLPKDIDPGLTATAVFDVHNDGTFSNATHGVVVELHEGTGQVEILAYFCVEDCGVAVNPQVVEGQCRGGIAQGISGALFEQITYDAQGEPSATSFMDYKVPTAHEIPEVVIHHLETPCAFTATGAKGAGEGGTIGAPAAVLNAVNDALRPTGVELDNTPITPETVHRALIPRTPEQTP
ncbi:xanthine dehydrogenase family protein molybdopterin-binding subunit [Streptomyces rapamycinicus]|uniref:Xanthine dehydrogenase n=2 Tax=Streptomyces rapamycinicus TaxID=1226757 RepID=A0A0A0NSA6_STRRN|nr:xanthine dehydrogenase family protein molybdopterin-binding subunit [Streptomyces rapamycinicus]AGP60281.1 xanthine dehydrogenase [Streptomyces rapamycinicus NRRL 5491]MBB4788555.1 carbon-monoxide dehydrogenase large subunit [Streptomyces rapamycinicus]RLV72887.1 xanthine dehydrogenase [Streptomyces rapamycinicus NRRL 5491]UTP35861.1 xanthine dehydrogenase family protein molybdopterin-binding subunit [Streptomyces rapamycinicus NRRL 5491]